MGYIPVHNQQPSSANIKLPAIHAVLHNKQHKITSPTSNTTSKLFRRPEQKYNNIFKGLDPLIDLNDCDNATKDQHKSDRVFT